MSDEIQGPLDPAQVAREALARHNDEVRARMRAQTRRSFVAAGGAAVAGFAGFGWVMSRRPDEKVSWPMRRALAVNEGFLRGYYSPRRLAPHFTRKAPFQDRVNSHTGMGENFHA